MITPRSASKFDLFAQAGRHRKLEEVGDPLQVIAKHIDFNELAALVAPFLRRGDGSKGWVNTNVRNAFDKSYFAGMRDFGCVQYVWDAPRSYNVSMRYALCVMRYAF